MTTHLRSLALLATLFLAGCSTPVEGDNGDGDEEQPLTAPVALDRMTPQQTWHGLHGGLVDNGEPTVTPVNGRIVIIAVSMSNGFREFNRFIALYGGHADVEPEIGLVNCAQGGFALEAWLSMDALWAECVERVTNAGFQPEQVRVVWAKNAHFEPSGFTLPHAEADYHDLVESIAALSRRIGDELPSVQAIFHSSRIYGGYVAPALVASRGEPVSYEGGFAINAVIGMQKNGELDDAPWVGWGPYLWADGDEPNGSGIVWLPSDFDSDLFHPAASGQTKVADALHEHFMHFDWYRD